MARLPTLGDTKRIRCNLWANCTGPNCGHGAKLDLDALIARYGADYLVRQPGGFMERMRCSRCGHLGATPTVIPITTDVAKLNVRRYIMPPK